jgi:hypothetical protein
MNIALLLARLSTTGIYIDEDRKFQDGTRVLILRCKLPTFPMGDQQRWHIFVLEPGQTDVDRKEIEAMLRRFWHASTPFFDDELNQTAHPVDLIPPKEK